MSSVSKSYVLSLLAGMRFTAPKSNTDAYDYMKEALSDIPDVDPTECKWRAPTEVTEPGLYMVQPVSLVAALAEPGTYEPATYVFNKVGEKMVDYRDVSITDPFYNGCKFFGPIPTYEK